MSSLKVSMSIATRFVATLAVSAVVTAAIANTPVHASSSNVSLSSISPTSMMATSTGFTLNLTGANFAGTSKAYWGSTPMTMTCTSPTQIVMHVSSSFIAQAGTVPIKVIGFNGVASTTLNFTVIPAPAMSALSPTAITATASGCTLTVSGSNFYNDTAITWNHQAIPTTYVSPTTLTANITSAMVALPMVSQVAIVEPTGVGSGPIPFTIKAHANVSGISPSAAMAQSPGFPLQVTGANFTSGSAITWNGQRLATTVVSPTQLTATIPASAITSVTPITVSTADPDGSTANALPFTVTPAPTLSAISPNVITATSNGFSANLTGANLSGSYKVTWNGTPISCKFVSSTLYQPFISSNLLATPGTAVLQVVAPNGVVSNTETFTIYSVPSPDSISPLSVNAGAPTTTLTVTGTKFVKGWTVQWNGVSLPTTFVSVKKLTVQVPASDLAVPNTSSITVTSPDGIVSSPLTFRVLVDNTASTVSLWSTKMVWAHCMQHLTYSIPASGTTNLYGSLYPLDMQNVDPSDTPAMDVQLAKASGIDGFDVDIFTTASGIDDYLTAADSEQGFVAAPCIDLSVMTNANATPQAMEDAVVQTVTDYAAIAATHSSAARDKGSLMVFTYGTFMPLTNWQNAVNRVAAAGISVSWLGDIDSAFNTPNVFPQTNIQQMMGIFGAGYIWTAQHTSYWDQTVALYQQQGKNFCGTLLPGKDRSDGYYIDAHNTQLLQQGWQRQMTETNSNWIQLTTWNSYIEGTCVSPSSDWNETRSDMTQWYAAQFKGQPAPFSDVRLYVTTPKAVALNQASEAEAVVINPTSSAVTVHMTLYDGNGVPASNQVTGVIAANSLGTVTLSTNFVAVPAGQFVRAKAFVTNTSSYVAAATSAPVIVYGSTPAANVRLDYYSVPSDNSLQGPVALSMTPAVAGQSVGTVVPPVGANVRFAEILANTVEVNNFYNSAPYAASVPSTSGTFYVARVIDQNKCVGYSDPIYVGP